MQQDHQMCFLICFSTSVKIGCVPSTVQLSALRFMPRSIAYGKQYLGQNAVERVAQLGPTMRIAIPVNAE